MKFFLPALALSFVSLACATTNQSIADNSKQKATHATLPSTSTNNIQPLPQNIIMVIGDGMGPAYTTAYRYFSDNPETTIVEQTVFDRHLTGLSTTYPASISGVVTDSAASATALATGVKSYNGAIGVDVNKNEVQTVLEWAKLQGKKTGVIVTSQINHATPASYLTHNEYRKNYNEIADSYIDNGIKADLYLGGGWNYFIREDRNLVNEFKQAGFHYIDNYSGLSNLPNNKPVLGLFADKGLPWALDDTNKHRLSTMTKAGIHHLLDLQQSDTEEDNGFFMLIEGSQVDWAGHGNDISSAMAEMDDLAKTIEYLEHFVEHHPNTLVIVTADHGDAIASHGAGWDKYSTYTEEVGRVPLVMRWPANIKAGQRSERLVSGLDVTASLVAAAKADLSDLDGRDLLADAPIETEDEVLVVEHYGHSGDVAFQRIVYHGDWKYVVAWGDDDEFYNLADDPYELSNRLQDDTVINTLRKLQQFALDDLRQERAAREIEFPQSEMEFKLVISNDHWPREERLLQYKLERALGENSCSV